MSSFCRNSAALGASPDIFVNGTIGLGWIKTIYGDAKQSIYSYNSSLERRSDGPIVLCNEFEQYGGFTFATGPEKPNTDRQVSIFAASQGLEFYIPVEFGVPNFILRLSNLMQGSCNRDVPLGQGDSGEVTNGWRRFYFPLSSFECNGEVRVEDLNRVQWEARGSGMNAVCVKDIRLVLQGQGQQVAAAEGRRR